MSPRRRYKAFGQIFYDLARNDQADDGRHERGGAGDISALGAFPGGPGRADAMLTAADGHILQRPDRRLFRIDDFQRAYAALSAFPPHHFGQRADRGFIDIRHPERRGVHFIAGAHTADDGCAVRDDHRVGADLDLCRDRPDDCLVRAVFHGDRNFAAVLPKGAWRIPPL